MRVTKMDTPEPRQFERVIIFFNPASTNATAAKRRIAEIKKAVDVPVKTIETSSGGERANAKLLESANDQLGPQTLLCIAAGDGTTNLVIQTLIKSQKLSPQAKLTPVLPLWGGNANDLAHMLNGPAYRARLKQIITKGNVIPIHPLQCETQAKGSQVKKTHIAACYASFGATAFAAKQLNASTHRKSPLHAIPGGRYLQELLTVFGALMEAPSFAVKDSKDVKVVYERTFSNGSRMAKIKRLPVELTDEMFYLNTFENKKLLSVLPRLFKSTQRRLAGKFLSSNTGFTTQEESWAQFDGEPVKIPAHTKVRVQLSPVPFYALATMLGAKKQTKP